jgi:hypothetical protein
MGVKEDLDLIDFSDESPPAPLRPSPKEKGHIPGLTNKNLVLKIPRADSLHNGYGIFRNYLVPKARVKDSWDYLTYISISPIANTLSPTDEYRHLSAAIFRWGTSDFQDYCIIDQVRIVEVRIAKEAIYEQDPNYVDIELMTDILISSEEEYYTCQDIARLWGSSWWAGCSANVYPLMLLESTFQEWVARATLMNPGAPEVADTIRRRDAVGRDLSHYIVWHQKFGNKLAAPVSLPKIEDIDFGNES